MLCHGPIFGSIFLPWGSGIKERGAFKVNFGFGLCSGGNLKFSRDGHYPKSRCIASRDRKLTDTAGTCNGLTPVM